MFLRSRIVRTSSRPVHKQVRYTIRMTIVLDGAKGAGKSSVSKILMGRLDNAIFLSLDNERHALKYPNGNRKELNRQAFENILEKAKEVLRDKANIIIDCGLTEERSLKLDLLALDTNTKLYKFFLKAHHDTLLDRVRLRDATKGIMSDRKRFEETYDLTTSKDLKNFIIIETDELSIESIAKKILDIVV